MLYNALCIMILKSVYLYENNYITSTALQLVPKQLCRTHRDIEHVVESTKTDSLVARRNNGQVILTGTCNALCQWIATQNKPVWIEPNLLSLHQVRVVYGFRFTSTPQDTWLSTVELNVSHDLLCNADTIFHNIVTKIYTLNDCQQYIFNKATEFVDLNAHILPQIVSIDICSIQGLDTTSATHFITNIQQMSESDEEDADDT